MKCNATALVGLIVLAFCACLFSTCSKDYSYEGGPSTGITTGPAIYTVSSLAGECTPSNIAGKYYVGQPLTATNTVGLQVNVGSVGTYSLATDAKNGIRFVASGVFTSTGTQTILLKGSGTPAAAGNYIFRMPDSSKCLFAVAVTKPPATIARFTLAGAPNNCEGIFVQGEYTAGKRLNQLNLVTLTVNVTVPGPYTIQTDTLDGVSFSAAGAFTASGMQQVVLAGTGVPANPQNLVFSPLGDSTSCTFNVSVANQPPLATYVLESGGGATNPCIYSVAGNYISGTPLVAANTVTVKVYVTVVGNFTIATNTVNGIEFSYTGSFTNTGSQNVLLQGSGTPVAKGSFYITPAIVGPHPIGGEACGVSVVVK